MTQDKIENVSSSVTIKVIKQVFKKNIPREQMLCTSRDEFYQIIEGNNSNPGTEKEHPTTHLMRQNNFDVQNR